MDFNILNILTFIPGLQAKPTETVGGSGLKRFILGVMIIMTASQIILLDAQSPLTYYKSTKITTGCVPDEFVLAQQKPQSLLLCAAVCRRHSCSAFAYEDKNCTMTSDSSPVTEEVLVFKRVTYEPSFINVALSKSTTAVNFWDDLVSELAVDGDVTPSSYYHSSTGINNPWWYVDLGQNYLINEVQAFPNGSGIHTVQFQAIEVRIGTEPPVDGNFSTWILLGFYEGPPAIIGQIIKFPQDTEGIRFCGRYVSVQKTSSQPNEYFAFNEIKVLAYAQH